MTRKVFWEDPYLAELDTRVASVDGCTVTLDETIFYAFAGGQERDFGTIGGREVLDAEKRDREIVYTLPDGHGLAVGSSVYVTIDWQRRYALMRLHFAAELVLELAYQNLAGIEKIGAHISEQKSRIDFKWPESIAPALPLLEDKANAIIAADLAIVSAFSDELSERRYWEIEGFAKVPCGGTHLKRTGEIGSIKLKRVNIGKGCERIEIRLA